MTGPAIHLPGNPFAEEERVAGAHLPGNPFADGAAGVDDNPLHAEFKSGALARRMAAENAADAGNASDEATDHYTGRFATHVLSAAQGIPGMEAVEAAAGAAGSHLAGGQPLSYRESLDALRQATGNIPKAVRVGEQILGSAPVLPFLPSSAIKGGAAFGALQGALRADPETALERAQATLRGAAEGAATGALLKGAGAGVGAMGRAIGIPEAVSRLAQAAADRVPEGSMMERAAARLASATGSRGEAARTILTRMESENRTPADLLHVAAMRTGTSGAKPELMADLLPAGNELEKLTKSVAKTPGPGRAAVTKAITQRMAGTRGRLLADLDASTALPDAPDLLARLAQDREQAAQRLFPAAYRAGEQGIDDPAIQEILSRPTFQKAYKMAQTMAADEGKPLPTRTVTERAFRPEFQQLLDQAKPGDQAALESRLAALPDAMVETTREVPVPDVRTVHYVDRAIRNMIDQGFEGNAPLKDPGHAKVLQDTFEQLRDRMTSTYPEFGVALSDYAKRSRGIEALSEGLNFLKTLHGGSAPDLAMGEGDQLALKVARQGLRGLQEAVKRMAPGERTLFQTGAQQAVRDAMASVPADVAGSTSRTLTSIFSNSPEGAEWRRLLFPDVTAANRFQQAITREYRMAATNRMLGGSDTAENLAEADQLRGRLGLASSLMHPRTALKEGAARATEQAAKRAAAALGDRLAATGPGALPGELSALREDAALQAGAQRVGGAARTALAGKITRPRAGAPSAPVEDQPTDEQVVQLARALGARIRAIQPGSRSKSRAAVIRALREAMGQDEYQRLGRSLLAANAGRGDPDRVAAMARAGRVGLLERAAQAVLNQETRE